MSSKKPGLCNKIIVLLAGQLFFLLCFSFIAIKQRPQVFALELFRGLEYLVCCLCGFDDIVGSDFSRIEWRCNNDNW